MKLSSIFLLLLPLVTAVAVLDPTEDNTNIDLPLLSSHERRLQDEVETQVWEDSPYTPKEVQAMLHTFLCAKYRCRLSAALKDADTDGDGQLDDMEMNVFLSKACTFALVGDGGELTKGQRNLLTIIIIIFIKCCTTIIIIIIIITGECTRDPHIMTFGGKHLAFNGVCDLLLLKNSGFAGGAGLEIQVRTGEHVTESGVGSVIIAATVKIGQDILEVAKNGTHYLNGVEDAPLDGLSVGGGFNIYKEPGEYCFGPGLNERCAPSFNFDISTEVVDFLDVITSQHIYITAHRGFLDISVEFNDQTLTGSSGLMGTYPAEGSNDKIGRDGSTVYTDSVAFGFEWQVRPTEGDSITFQEARAPQYPEMCTLTSVVRRNLRDEISE